MHKVLFSSILLYSLQTLHGISSTSYNATESQNNVKSIPSFSMENFACSLKINQFFYPKHEYKDRKPIVVIPESESSAKAKTPDNTSSNTQNTPDNTIDTTTSSFEYCYSFSSNQSNNTLSDLSNISGILAYNLWPLLYSPSYKPYTSTYRQSSNIDEIHHTVRLYVIANLQQDNTTAGLHFQTSIAQDFNLSLYFMANSKLWPCEYGGVIISYLHTLYVHFYVNGYDIQQSPPNYYTISVNHIDITYRITDNWSFCIKNYHTALSKGDSTFLIKNTVSLIGFQYLYQFKKIYVLFDFAFEWPINHYWSPYISISFNYNDPYDHTVLMHNHSLQDPVMQMLKTKTEEYVKILHQLNEENKSKDDLNKTEACSEDIKKNLLKIFEENNDIIEGIIEKDEKSGKNILNENKAKSFYKKASIKYHPDQNSNNDERVALFKTLNNMKYDELKKDKNKKELFITILQDFLNEKQKFTTN